MRIKRKPQGAPRASKQDKIFNKIGKIIYEKKIKKEKKEKKIKNFFQIPTQQPQPQPADIFRCKLFTSLFIFIFIKFINLSFSQTLKNMTSIIKLRICKLPTTESSLTNKVYVNQQDLDATLTNFVRVQTSVHHYVFSLANHIGVKPGEIGFSLPQRRWTNVSLEQEIQAQPFSFKPGHPIITFINLAVDFQKKPTNLAEPIDSDQMAREFLMQFGNMPFSKDQELVFEFNQIRRGTQNDQQQKPTTYTFKLVVKKMEGTTINSSQQECDLGPLSPNAVVIFDRPENSQINLIGRSKGKSSHRALINPDWDFQQMGIGGLDKEFSAIFRRAFASRVFPPEFIEQLAMKHVRGILLFGPPGTGKTLIARQIGKMLNAREPKIVNGPEILNKYVGESEANMRKLFAEAEEEFRRCGSNSGLHIIIFDEIDAICKQRGSMAGSSTGVHDTVVNQLLTKLDGVEQLNNILVIGMTNRKDMIDEALLRPGRMEVQLEISLPDEHGRVQILKIHTARMREYKKLDPSVDLADIGRKTKNFSGAELEGLVRAAQSSAMNRLVKAGGKVQVDEDAVEKLMITRDDFDYALENDIKPAFGHNDEELGRLLYGGLVCWGDPVTRVLDQGDLLIKETAAIDTRGFVRALLAGAPNSGKTYLAAHIARKSEFPFIKVCTPEDMVGYSETAKCAQLRKIFEDAYKSPLSCIIIDNIERLLDYSPIGPRYSNLVLQALLVLLGKRPPKDRRLLVLATTSNEHFLREADLHSSFSTVIHVERLTTASHVAAVLEDSNAFSTEECRQIETKLAQIDNGAVAIGIKRMLELIDFVKQGEPEYRVDLMCDAFQAMKMGID